MGDIVDRLRTAETAPLDADGKVALFLVLQDARDEIARLREEREQIMRRRWVVRCGFYDDATTILDAIRAVRPPLVIEWTAEDGVVDQVERMQPLPSPQPGGEVEADQATRGSGDEIARLSAERDAAILERDAARKECERLGQIVSKYQETRQWDIEKIEDGCVRICFGDHHRALDCEWEYFIPASREADFKNQRSGAIRERDEARAECERLRHLLNTKERECETHHPWVHPTEAAPPPRGWLTKEDCEALYLANAVLHGVFVGSWQEKHDAAKRLEAIRWRALGAAGGEVE